VKRSEGTDGRARLLVVLGDGGHTVEILRLLELLGSDYAYCYVAAEDDRISGQRIAVPGPLFRIRRPRSKGEPWWSATWHLLVSLAQAFRVWRRVRPQALLGSGPSIMVPVALAARLHGSKVIFVETGSRVTSLSLTGRIMLRLAHLFFVQWQQLQQRYPGTVFAGRLL